MRNFFLLTFLLLRFWSFSQKEYTVEQCIDLGIKNAQNTISQESRIQQSFVNQQFGKYSFLPTLNANTGYNSNYGRKIDPFTNTFGLNVVNSNSLGVSSQLILFQGFRYFKQNKVFNKTTSTSKFDLERTNEKIKNQVIDKCILIWKAQSKIDQQDKIISDLKTFKARQTDLVKEGRLSAIDTLTTSINIKTQTITLLNLKREVSFETINLNFLIGLPVLNETKIENFKTSIPDYQITLDEYFQVEDLKNKLMVLELQNKVDKTQFVPTLSFYGNVGTGYYSSNKDYSIPEQPIISYPTQFRNNAYQALGFSLNVPLFNKGEYFRKQKIYAISKQEQIDLIAFKEIEITKKKSELIAQKRYVEEALLIQNEILKDKKTIVDVTQLIYLEGKIRLSEVEKVEAEYYAYLQAIQDLEIELLKISRVKLD
jgi:outer membrane protein